MGFESRLPATCALSVMPLLLQGAAPALAQAVFRADDYAALQWSGEGRDDWFSNRVFVIDDMDGDELGDVLVAARRWDQPPVSEWVGKFYLYSSADGRLIRTFEGEGDLDEFSHRVVSLGDIDGDLFPDFAVSAYLNDEGGLDAGKVYVYSGRNGALLESWIGQAGDILGFALLNTGDLDGDGTTDFVFSAYGRDISGGNDQGQVFAISGATLDTLYQHDLVGESDGAQFGQSVKAAGDADNDGRPDFVVGAANHSEATLPEVGRVYLYSGADGSLIRSYTGDRAYGHFGERVQCAGDVDSDQHDDLLVTSCDINSVAQVEVFSGQHGDWLAEYATGQPNDFFGARMARLGDVDGDGHDDFIISARGNDTGGQGAGLAWVVSGETLDVLYEHIGEAPGDLYGAATENVGDVNADGYADYLVTAPRNDTGGFQSGTAYMYSGRFGRQLYKIVGPGASHQFGDVALDGGDINMDGLPDFTVGSRHAVVNGIPDVGRAYVFVSYSLYLGVEVDLRTSTATAHLSGAEPREEAYLLVSLLSPAPGPVLASLGNLQLDIRMPIFPVGIMQANEYGEMAFPMQIPPNLKASQVHFQAIVVRGANGGDSVKSNVFTVGN